MGLDSNAHGGIHAPRAPTPTSRNPRPRKKWRRLVFPACRWTVVAALSRYGTCETSTANDNRNRPIEPAGETPEAE